MGCGSLGTEGTTRRIEERLVQSLNLLLGLLSVSGAGLLQRLLEIVAQGVSTLSVFVGDLVPHLCQLPLVKEVLLADTHLQFALLLLLPLLREV